MTSDLHNRLAPEITLKLVKDVRAAGGDQTDLWIIVESVVLGVVITSERYFNMTRQESVEIVELMTSAVFERLGKIPPGGRPPVPR